MKANERLYHQGGLMRCCIKTLCESIEETLIGDICTCPHCHSQMQVGVDGAWRWVKPTGQIFEA